MVTVEAVARMDVTELEACLTQALNPRMPVEVLRAVLARLHSPQAASKSAETGEQTP